MANKIRTFAADSASGLKTIPADALRFDAGPFKFAGDKPENGNRPITMLARTAAPIEHWYWGKIVHDMAGMKLAAPKLPIDYCHDPEEVLGYLDKFDPGNNGLTVTGELVSFQPDDRTAEVCHKADNGVPYQSSIYFDSNNYVLEVVMEGYQTMVNGFALQGPACVIREWTLMAVSVCPYGADSGSRTQLSAANGANEVSITIKEACQMAATPAAAPTPAEATPTPATQLTAPTQPATQTTATVADPRAEFQAQLTKFTAKFGPANGAKWAAEGLSYEAALEQHVTELAAANQTLTGQVTELNTKLAAVPRGEQAPVSFTTNEKHEGGQAVPSQFSKLGKIGAFAASLKIPGAK